MRYSFKCSSTIKPHNFPICKRRSELAADEPFAAERTRHGSGIHAIPMQKFLIAMFHPYFKCKEM